MQLRNEHSAQGIDVSHHNGPINWGQVAADGRKFVYIKAGQNSIDPKFLENVRGARAAGLLIGAYFYLDKAVTSAAAAKVAAGKFADWISQAGGVDIFDLPPALDYEESAGLSRDQISAIARAFMEELQRLTGRKPIIYTGNSFGQNFTSDIGDYALWVARYSTQAPADMPAWSKWTIWQYSQSGKVPGIASENVDLNEFNGTVDELRAWAAGNLDEAEEEDIDMGKAEDLEKRIKAMEKKLNMSGKEPLPAWAEPAVIAGKAAGAITTSADKSVVELTALQMLFNIGLLDKDIIAAIQRIKIE